MTAESRKDRKAGTTGKAGSLGTINASCVNRGTSSKITYSGETCCANNKILRIFPIIAHWHLLLSQRLFCAILDAIFSVPYWTLLTRYKGQNNKKKMDPVLPASSLATKLGCKTKIAKIQDGGSQTTVAEVPYQY